MGPYRVIHGGVAAIELAALRSEAEALARDDPPNFDNGCVLEPLGPAHLADDDETWRRSRAAYEVVRRPRPTADVGRALFVTLARLARAELGVDRVWLFNEHFVVKPPLSEIEFKWHVDADEQLQSCLAQPAGPYMSCWVALDDAHAANGCLVVRSDSPGGEVALECAAGDVVALRSDCAHRSGPNATRLARRAYYAQFSSEPITSAPNGPVLRLAIECTDARGEDDAREADARDDSGAAVKRRKYNTVDGGDADAADGGDALLERLASFAPRLAAATTTACAAEADGVAALLARAVRLSVAEDWAGAADAWRAVADVAWKRLHDPETHWRAVGAHWRELYAVSAFRIATCVVAAPGDGGARARGLAAVRVVDLALMLDNGTHRRALLRFVDALERTALRRPPGLVSSRWIERPAGLDAAERQVCAANLIAVLARPSVAEFQKHCFDTAAAAKITGALSNWPALHGGRCWRNAAYLEAVAGHRVVPVERGKHYLDDEWTEQLCTFAEFIRDDVLEASAPRDGAAPLRAKAYLAQHALFDQIPALRADVAVPPYCAAASPGEEAQPPTLNAWFGPRGTLSPLHHDRYHNLLCQVVGSKYVRLYAREHAHRLYARAEGDVHAISSEVVDIDHVDAAKHPLFARAPYTETILEAGEMLYIPPHVWHYVESREVSFSVSFWWP